MSWLGFMNRLELPQRRIVACVGILIFLMAYLWGVTTLGGYLPTHPVIQILFYGVAGLAWGIPVLPLISWSEKYRSDKRQKRK